MSLRSRAYSAIAWLDSFYPKTGDIQDLYQTRLEPGHAAAFASDCELPSTHEMVRSIGMQVGVSRWEGEGVGLVPEILEDPIGHKCQQRSVSQESYPLNSLPVHFPL